MTGGYLGVASSGNTYITVIDFANVSKHWVFLILEISIASSAITPINNSDFLFVTYPAGHFS